MQISEIIAPYKKKDLSLMQVKNLSLALSKIPEEVLLTAEDFNQSFNYYTKSFLGYSHHKVHITTLFMHNPQLFSKLIKNNNEFLEKFEEVNKIQETREYTPFYFLKTLESKTPELLKIAFENKLTVNVESAFFDMDDIYKSVEFFNKTGINVVEALCLYHKIEISEHLQSSMNLSYISTLPHLSSFRKVHENKYQIIETMLKNELERGKVIYPDNDKEAARRSASFIKNFETFKKMMGNIEIVVHGQNEGMFTIQIMNTPELILDVERKAEISFNQLAATLDNRVIEKKINAVISEQPGPESSTTQNDRSFKL